MASQVQRGSPPRLQLLSGSASTSGVDFEHKMAALVKLRLRRVGAVESFALYRNVRAARPFDDLVVRFSTASATYQALVQLKHAEKKGETITLQAFCGKDEGKKQKGDFNLRKYYETFQKLDDSEPGSNDASVLREVPAERTCYVIYTNKYVKDTRSRGTPLPSEESFDLMRQLLDTSSHGCSESACFRFDEKDSKVWTLFEGDERGRYQERFLRSLFVFDRQAHESDLDKLICREMDIVFGDTLKGDVSTNLFNEFMMEMERWMSEVAGEALWEESALLEKAAGAELRRRARQVTASATLLFSPAHRQPLLQALSCQQPLRIHVPGVPAGLRAAKLIQILDEEHSDQWLYINEQIMDDFPKSVLQFARTKTRVIAFDFKESTRHTEAMDILKPLGDEEAAKLITFVSSRDESIISEEWKLEQLTTECQDEIKQRTVLFQGHKTTLGDMQSEWGDVHKHVDGGLITSLWTHSSPQLGSALPSLGDEGYCVVRALHHQSALQGNDVLSILQKIGKDEKLALSGFSRKQIQKLRKRQKKLKDCSPEPHSLESKRIDTFSFSLPLTVQTPALSIPFNIQFQNNPDEETVDWKSGWTVLHGKGIEKREETSFRKLCFKNPQYTIHWVEYKNDQLIWRETFRATATTTQFPPVVETTNITNRQQCISKIQLGVTFTKGDRDAISRLVRVLNVSCQKPPSAQCVHRGGGEGKSSLLEEVAAWESGPFLLLGDPGMGKTHFLRSVARQRKAQRPRHWVLMVEVLQHSDVLERMPAPNDIQTEHVYGLLAAAAGVQEGSTTPEGSFLRSALDRGAAIAVLVDGVDEVCPLHKDKILACLRILRTRVRPLWVASRPEVEGSLCDVLQSIPLYLSPLSSDEQAGFLRERWNASIEKSSSRSPQIVDDLIRKVDVMFNRVRDGSNGERSLLEVPLNLNLTADVFENKLHESSSQEIPNLNLLQLYRCFVERNRDRHRERFRMKDEVQKNTYIEMLLDKAFKDIHQSFAMFLMVQTSSIPDNNKDFEHLCNEWREFVSMEKNGILWLNYNGIPQFSHRTFMEYFAAQWIFDNKDTIVGKIIIREVMQNHSTRQVREFVDMMLVDGFPAYLDIIFGYEPDEGEMRLDANRTDRAGRSLLHLAAAYG